MRRRSVTGGILGSGQRGGGSGRRETAVDERRKETSDRVANYQTDCAGRTCLSMLLAPKTAAAALKVLLLFFGFPVLSFRSWSYSVDVVALSCFVSHLRALRGAHDTSCFAMFSNSIILCVSLSLPFFPVIALPTLRAALQ